MPPPPLIATIGLHASASTWVFNVVRELMIDAVDETNLLTLYADEVAQLPDASASAGRYLVIKSHHGSPGLDAWLAARRAVGVLSIRDPRDACVSMAQRFKRPLGITAGWVANDCSRMMRLANQGYTLLRYEDRFFEDEGAVSRLAGALGLQPTRPAMETIFARYGTEAVRSFAGGLENLPAERISMVGEFRMDKVTQILGPHIGDARSGKWHDLPLHAKDELTRIFGPFLDRFGYRR